MERDIQKPKLAKNLVKQPADREAMAQAVEEAREWRDAVARATEGVESRGGDDTPVRLR